jgi:RimJ/RimL family protein N-acetyltransferase
MLETLRAQFFPHTLVDGTVIENWSDRPEFWAHASPLMDAIFTPYPDLGAYGYAIPEARRAAAKPLTALFGRSHHEHFLFWGADSAIIGYGYGDMRDAQTFFMTSSGVLPAYRGRGVYSGYVRQLLAYLAALGYERVISNHHPNNRAVLIAKLKLGFSITAVNLDERWGAQVELTYLFHQDRRDAYCRAFSLHPYATSVSHEVPG